MNDFYYKTPSINLTGEYARYKKALITVAERVRLTTYVPNPLTRYKTSTGNLAFNAIRYRQTLNSISLIVDGKIAPYYRYINKGYWLNILGQKIERDVILELKNMEKQ